MHYAGYPFILVTGRAHIIRNVRLKERPSRSSIRSLGLSARLPIWAARKASVPLFQVQAAGATVVKAMLGMLLIILAGCGDSADTILVDTLSIQRQACSAATEYRLAACTRQCPRFNDVQDAAQCDSVCESEAEIAAALCDAPLHNFASACRSGDCAMDVQGCRADAAAEFVQCSEQCDANGLRCQSGCESSRAIKEEACGFAPAMIESGGVPVRVLDRGQPAFLPGLLDDREMAVVEAADRRAESLRSRPVKLWTGEAGTQVRVTQLEHHFSFGVPLDLREFEQAEAALQFYGGIARDSTSLLVMETSLKWRNVEREQGQRRFDLADTELAWGEGLGFDIKAHVLVWGNQPPLASGSGTPEWLRERFPDKSLSEGEKGDLRELIRDHIHAVVGRYSGRIDVWEVTNEMLNPITDWFASRLGQEVVDDLFRWAREADPGAQLVYNEWINEIFTGIGGPDAQAVRDRVLALRRAGTPVDAVGQQGHFAPGLVNIGVDVDLSQRTRVDDYAAALDTLAQTGLPIHITEVTFAAPEEPEHRAAMAEAILRIWWGHPAVEEVIFWNFWNPLGPRSHLNLGVYGDEGQPTRHGEAILSLLNDRWRTDVEGVTDSDGAIEVRATHGQYVAQWNTAQGPVHIRFRVTPGVGALDVVAVR